MAESGDNQRDGANTGRRRREQDLEAEGSGSGKSSSAQSRVSPVLKRSSTTPFMSAGTSATTSPKPSPKPSRETSPTRQHAKTRPNLSAKSPARSRKNSVDRSPVRATGAAIPTVPSAAAIQRALSAAGATHPSASTQHDDRSDPQRLQRTARTTGGPTPKSTPRTPRLSSPPPSNSAGSNPPLPNTSKRPEQSQSTPTTPSVALDRSIPGGKQAEGESQEDFAAHRTGTRTPIRGASGSGAPLETVQEGNSPSKPTIGASRAGDKSKTSDRPEKIKENPMEGAFENDSGKTKAESGNESSKNSARKPEDEAKEGWRPSTDVGTSSSKPPAIHSKKSLTNLPGKLRAAAEGSVKNMTVETETVSSVPQVAVGGTGERSAPGRSDTAGSLRLKNSTETIRPKKDKKKVMKKTTSLNTGTGGYQSRFSVLPCISTDFTSVEFREGSSLGSSRNPVFDFQSEDDLLSPLHQSSPTETLPSGQSSFSSIYRPRLLRQRWSLGLMSFRSRTASSKADIFEAKVASAVGEADSSDSGETFVYESNPPEQPSARKFHSRTPSTASTLSQIDHFGTKNRQDSHHNVAKKKSMKFATNYSTITSSTEDTGTVRGPSQANRVNTPHHHHIGRFARGGHPSILDKESPFSNGSKTPRTAAAQLQHSARHIRQGSPTAARLHGSSRKAEEMLYDAEAEAADDERAPLIGSVRSGRNRRRPLPGSVRQVYADNHRQRHCGRVTAFVSLGSLLALLIAAIILIVILCTKPLFHVAIQDIRNVLASESEIMIDLEVSAINPDIIAITVSDLDLNIFAKSRYVGTSYITPSLSTRTSSRFPSRKTRPVFLLPGDTGLVGHGIDEGTDPIPVPDDPASDSQTMLLGRILNFDSPLTFDASPLHHRPSVSIGEVRLSRPGNRTEEGGSLRWERVLQHDFELIVRGVIKYSLPISSKTRSASIGGKVIVHPTEEDSEGGMKITKPRLRNGDDGGSNVIIEPHQPPPVQTKRLLRSRRA